MRLLLYSGKLKSGLGKDLHCKKQKKWGELYKEKPENKYKGYGLEEMYHTLENTNWDANCNIFRGLETDSFSRTRLFLIKILKLCAELHISDYFWLNEEFNEN